MYLHMTLNDYIYIFVYKCIYIYILRTYFILLLYPAKSQATFTEPCNGAQGVGHILRHGVAPCDATESDETPGAPEMEGTSVSLPHYVQLWPFTSYNWL